MRRWKHELRKEIEELEVQGAKLQHYLESDLVAAVAALSRMADAIDRYAQPGHVGDSAAGASRGNLMTTCDLQTGLGQIAHAASQLQAGWTAAQGHWTDEASRNFEEAHLREIPARLQLLVAAVQRLAAAVERAERRMPGRAARRTATGRAVDGSDLGRGD